MRGREKMKRAKIFLRGIVLITLIGLLFHFGQGILDPQEGLSLQRHSNQQPGFDLNAYQPVDDSSWNIQSRYALLVNRETGRVLYQRKANQKMYPASLTKIMTVLVAIEQLEEEEMTVISDFTNLYESGAALAGFFPGETVRAIDLLYGTMLSSGAEAAESLAQNISGSVDNFVALMNQKARELGMNQTHFENVTGLHDKGHYTTAKDLAILLNDALSNEQFKQIFTAIQYEMPSTTNHPSGLFMASRMFAKLNDVTFRGGQFLGGKTGYTEEAGLCLASLASDGESEYILVTAGAPGGPRTEQTNISDAINLYERFLNE